VDRSAIDALAKALRDSGLDCGRAVETVLRSQLFFSTRNLNSRVSDPCTHVIGTLRALEVFDPPPSTLLLAEQIARLGQDLFYPPNVFGWRGGRSWVNTHFVLGRSTFASSVVDGRFWSSGQPFDALQLVKQYEHASDRSQMLSFFSKLLTGGELEPSARQKILAACDQQGLTDAEACRQMIATLLNHPMAQLA